MSTILKAVFGVLTISVVASANNSTHFAPLILLNDNNRIPALGFGTTLSNNQTPEQCQKIIELAIESGYRHLDTAPVYGTEDIIGRAVQEMVKKGAIVREDLFITTKLWNTKHHPDDVIPALKESLRKLQMDYVDLYLIHWPMSMNEDETPNDSLDYVDTWKSMEKAKESGLAKSIGLSNFNIEQMKRVLNSSTVKPTINQVEVNPTMTQKELVDFCHTNGIQVVAYTPLGSMPLNKMQLNGDQAPPPRLDDPLLMAMAKKYEKNTVQVVLRYLLDRELIPIPRTTNATRVKNNFDVFDFHLTKDEIETIDGFNKNYRSVLPRRGKDSKFWPF